MKDNKLEIVYKNVDDLIPYARNSRTHSEAQVNQIASSIKEFGMNAPIAIDADGGIIAGHGRVLACQKLGIKTVPTVCLSHLSETEKKAYIIADNKLALNAGWDLDLLKVELQDLETDNFDLSLTGFDEEEINGLLDDPLSFDSTDTGENKFKDNFVISLVFDSGDNDQIIKQYVNKHKDEIIAKIVQEATDNV
jgi:ParB-like chromosome segregation protein Spo0J